MANSKLKDLLAKQQQQVIDTISNLEVSEFFRKIPDVIRDRTRAGFGLTSLDGEGETKSLKALKESTMIKREYLERKGQLSDETAPPVSNLTESGALLDSIKFMKRGKRYIIDFDRRFKSNSGKSPDQYVDFVQDERPFFGLSSDERQQLEDDLAKKMEEEIKKIFR
jgi:phage gpG-like protein